MASDPIECFREDFAVDVDKATADRVNASKAQIFGVLLFDVEREALLLCLSSNIPTAEAIAIMEKFNIEAV